MRQRKILIAMGAFLVGCLSYAEDADLDTLFGSKTEVSGTPSAQTELASSVQGHLGKTNTEQQIFLRKLDQEKWQEALLDYPQAFETGDFVISPTGKALLAFLQFKVGLQITSLENLFLIAEPKKIHPFLLAQWRQVAPESHPVWSAAKIQWQPVWTEIWGPQIEFKVKYLSLLDKPNLEELKGLIARMPADIPERAQLSWNLVMYYVGKDEVADAAKVLNAMTKMKNNPISEDLMNLTAARLLFQKGYFDAAIKYDQKIGKKSEYWLEAQEEMTWSYLRLGQPQNTLAVTKTLINPMFKSQVSSEAHFTRALAQLKVCDYPGVATSLEDFPKFFKDRTSELNKLALKADTSEVKEIFSRMSQKRVKVDEVGPTQHRLPRFITRDEKLYRWIKEEKILLDEIDVAEKIYGASLAMGTHGLQGEYDSQKKNLKLRQEQVRASMFHRVQELAADEVRETKKILDKMHIIEAELIQQISVADRLVKASPVIERSMPGNTGSKARDVLRFPATQEIWMDELANYKVDLKKGCQAKRVVNE